MSQHVMTLKKPASGRLSPVLFCAIAICMVEVSFAAASETLVWQPDSGGDIAEAANWSPSQIPGETNEVDITKAQSAPITLADDFHVYATKLQADSSGAEMIIDMGGHKYLNDGSIEATKNTVYVFTNGTLKIATNSGSHPNAIKGGATLAFRGSETIYFESNLTASATGAMTVGDATASSLEVANGAKFYRYVGNTQSLQVKLGSRITVTNRSEMVVVSDAATKAALQTGHSVGSSNSRFELLDHSKLNFYGTVTCGATISTTNGLFLVDGGSVVTNMDLGNDSVFGISGTNNTLRITNGSAVTIPKLQDGAVANTCSALVEVDGGSTLRVGRADPSSVGYGGLLVGQYAGGSGHRLVVRNNSKLKADTYCYIGSGDSKTAFPSQCGMEIRDSSAEFSGSLSIGGFGSSNSLVVANSALYCTNANCVVGIGYKIATNNKLSGSASLANRLEVENSIFKADMLDVNGYLDAAGVDGPKAVVRVAGTNSTIKASATSSPAKFYNTELVFEIDPEGFVQTLVDIPKVDIASNSVVKVVLPAKSRRLLGGTKITLVKTEANQLAADETTTFLYSAEMCDLVKDVANGEIYITVKQPPGLAIIVR